MDAAANVAMSRTIALPIMTETGIAIGITNANAMAPNMAAMAEAAAMDAKTTRAVIWAEVKVAAMALITAIMMKTS